MFSDHFGATRRDRARLKLTFVARRWRVLSSLFSDVAERKEVTLRRKCYWLLKLPVVSLDWPLLADGHFIAISHGA